MKPSSTTAYSLALEKLLVVFFVVWASQPHSLCKCVFCPCAQRQVSKQVSLCSLELCKKFLAACCAAPLPMSGTCGLTGRALWKQRLGTVENQHSSEKQEHTLSFSLELRGSERSRDNLGTRRGWDGGNGFICCHLHSGLWLLLGGFCFRLAKGTDS